MAILLVRAKDPTTIFKHKSAQIFKVHLMQNSRSRWNNKLFFLLKVERQAKHITKSS